MGANNKNYQDHQRTFNNTSPSNSKKNSSGGSQRPSPSKSINIKTTPNKGGNARNNNSYFNSSSSGSNSSSRLSLSGSPTNSFFAGSKCFESPSPDALPQPPKTWMMAATTDSNNSTSTKSSTNYYPNGNRVRKALILPMDTNHKKSVNLNSSCAKEYATAFSTHENNLTNDHFTQSLKLLLNVNA